MAARSPASAVAADARGGRNGDPRLARRDGRPAHAPGRAARRRDGTGARPQARVRRPLRRREPAPDGAAGAVARVPERVRGAGDARRLGLPSMRTTMERIATWTRHG